MYFKQEKMIFILSGKILKWADQFTYLYSNISSTESNVNIHQAKEVECYWQVIEQVFEISPIR